MGAEKRRREKWRRKRMEEGEGERISIMYSVGTKEYPMLEQYLSLAKLSFLMKKVKFSLLEPSVVLIVP